MWFFNKKIVAKIEDVIVIVVSSTSAIARAVSLLTLYIANAEITAT